MNLSCDVIKDILPLYVEDLASSDTRRLVEEHLCSCNNCKKEYEKLCTSVNTTTDVNILPLKQLQKALNKRKYLIILYSLMLTLAIVAIIIGYLTSPVYIPFEKTPITIVQQPDNMIVVNFSNDVTGYEITKSSDNLHFINAWTSVWGKMMSNKMTSSIILNPNGEKITSIYYSQNNGNDDFLVYGRNTFPSGGVITLPRLVLAYYLKLAILLAVISGLILLIFRKNQKINSVFTKIFIFPIAYIIGHFCTKGLTTTSYSAAHDFYTILLVMIPIYCSILIGIRILCYRKLKNS